MSAPGTGPGSITDDGTPVDFYLLLPPDGEPEMIHGALGDGASVLELGAGVGRVTGPLAELGHPVVAVDFSAAMLAHVRGAETVCAPISGLDLGRAFDGVILASYLIGTPDDAERRALLDTCRRHVREGGQVLIERNTDAFFAAPAESTRELNGVTIAMRGLSVPAPDTVHGTMHYTFGDRHWTQEFTSRRFDTAELADAGLRFDRTLTDDGRWFAARPI